MPFSEAELLERRGYLGASEAAAALGLSKYFTPLQLWQAKLGMGGQIEETLPMMVGIALEPVTLHFAEKEIGPIHDRQLRIIDPDNPWRRATLDGRISKTEAVEAKTSGWFADWGKDETDVPVYHQYQAQHQMACDEDLTRVWFPVILGQRDFRLYYVARDDEMIELLTEGELAFMQKVIDQVEPDPINAEDLKIKYPVSASGKKIVATAEVEEWALMLHEVKQQKKILETNEDIYATKIKAFMQNAELLVNAKGQPLNTWKSHTKSLIDVTALRAQRPDIAAVFTKETVNRPLLDKVKD